MANDTGIVKRGRGRPRKERTEPEIQRGRGRPLGSKNKKKKSNLPARTGRARTTRPPALRATEKEAFIRHADMSNLPAETPEELAYNQKLINHVMRVNEIATHADKTDLLSLKSCFVNYLKLCQEDGFSVSNIAAYAAMGFYDVSHFVNFMKKKDEEYKQFAALVKNTCAMFREGMISDSKLNPVIGIFWQRNFDGLRNDTEQIQPVNGEYDTETENIGYKDKYRHLIGGASNDQE